MEKNYVVGLRFDVTQTDSVAYSSETGPVVEFDVPVLANDALVAGMKALELLPEMLCVCSVKEGKL